jgi:hypothetical protein
MFNHWVQLRTGCWPPWRASALVKTAQALRTLTLAALAHLVSTGGRQHGRRDLHTASLTPGSSSSSSSSSSMLLLAVLAAAHYRHPAAAAAAAVMEVESRRILDL